MDRSELLHSWLETQLGKGFTLSAPIGDASSRRYFRATLADGSTRIAMDAPPPGQDCRPFVKIAHLLQPAMRVPAVLAQDLEQGFLLLDDLGSVDYQTALKATDETAARALYLAAIDALVAMQAQVATDALPAYDAETMVADLDRFSEWYAARHLGQPLQGDELAVWERSRALLVARAQSQAKVCIHFDYHARNLMAGERPGVLDFQDARVGPVTYDLASLLKDMYIVWPEDFRLDLCIRYWEKARKAGLAVPASFDDFYADFEWMGVFRHIRTLGTFARLAHRDGKMAYVDDMPAALDYLRATCTRYSELLPLGKLLNRLTGFHTTVAYTF